MFVSVFLFVCLCLSLLFLLLLQDVSVCERDSQAVIAYLSKASDYSAHIKADYARLLSLLSQGAVSTTDICTYIEREGEGRKERREGERLDKDWRGRRGERGVGSGGSGGRGQDKEGREGSVRHKLCDIAVYRNVQ